jgi:hypothetical protein
MNYRPNIMIFSVFKGIKSDELNHHSVCLVLDEMNVPYSLLAGFYEDKQETSILVEGFEHRETVETFCKLYNQDCYLESHGNDRSTNLVFPDGSRTSIGVLTSVPKTVVTSSMNYSYSSDLDQYFVTI